MLTLTRKKYNKETKEMETTEEVKIAVWELDYLIDGVSLDIQRYNQASDLCTEDDAKDKIDWYKRKRIDLKNKLLSLVVDEECL